MTKIVLQHDLTVADWTVDKHDIQYGFTLFIPYLTTTRTHDGVQRLPDGFTMEYIDGHYILLTLKCSPHPSQYHSHKVMFKEYTTVYKIPIPKGAIWSSVTKQIAWNRFGSDNKCPRELLLKHGHILITLDHIYSQLYRETYEELIYALYTDSICEIRRCADILHRSSDIARSNGVSIQHTEYGRYGSKIDFMERARSDEAAMVLCDTLSITRDEMISIISRSRYCRSGKCPPGMVAFAIPPRSYEIPVWKSIPLKYGLSSSDINPDDDPFWRCRSMVDQNVYRVPTAKGFLSCAPDHIAARVDEMKRTHERVQLYKEELMASAWHPLRFSDWCLDSDECVLLKVFGSRSS